MLDDPENSEWSDVSVEFCGGTHLSNTQEAEAFVILEEVMPFLEYHKFTLLVDNPSCNPICRWREGLPRSRLNRIWYHSRREVEFMLECRQTVQKKCPSAGLTCKVLVLLR